MKQELFLPYRDMILKCIESCVTPNQLLICHDMVERFTEQFKYSIPAKDMADAIDFLKTAYMQEQAAMSV